MSFSHASVGGNIWSGLTTLAEDTTYAFPNWTDNNRGNPGWEAKIAEFETWVAAHASENDVFQNKFCYIDQDADFGTYRDSMISLASSYPSKTFVWWTMPITTDGSDNALRQAFNQRVRDYCSTNNKPLFDIADIESHTATGTAVTSAGNEALDPAQSSDGGHLNDLGSARAAKAQWVLMAKIAGSPISTGGATSTGPSSGGGPSVGTIAAPSANPNDGSGCAIAHSHTSRSPFTYLALLVVGMFMLRRSRAA
jgi:hypothetical protein